MANYKFLFYLVFFFGITEGIDLTPEIDGMSTIYEINETHYCGVNFVTSKKPCKKIPYSAQSELCCYKRYNCHESKKIRVSNIFSLFNGNLYSLVTYCDCDRKFSKCLSNVKGKPDYANAMGEFYFNQRQCIKRIWKSGAVDFRTKLTFDPIQKESKDRGKENEAILKLKYLKKRKTFSPVYFRKAYILN